LVLGYQGLDGRVNVVNIDYCFGDHCGGSTGAIRQFFNAVGIENPLPTHKAAIVAPDTRVNH
jgi:hypothetical protein